MRIIGGQFKSKKITIPKAFNGRPTTDFAREGLFNVLQNQIEFEDVKFLDLFAGSGMISYEFVSRGSSHITSIDTSIVHCNFINKTFRELNAVKSHCYKKDALHYIRTTEENYDLIFADPPFDLEVLDQIPDLVFDNEVLNEDGMFVLEHSDKHNFSSHEHFIKEKKYGHVRFSFFE